MLRVLMINTVFSGGGAAKIANTIFNQVNRYSNNDISAYFLCRSKGNDISEFVDDFGFSKIELYFNGLLTRIIGKDSYFSFTWKKCFNKDLIDKFDVIHFHNIHGYFFDIKTLKLLENKKVIWTFHDMWPITGHCSHSFECEKWISGCFKCQYKNVYPSILVDTSSKMYKVKKEIFNSINDLTIVVPSRWLYDKVKKSFLKNKKIKLINNGINKQIFYPRKTNIIRDKYNIGENKKIILFVAENIKNKWKGLQYLIDAINNLRDNKNLVLIVVGNNMNLRKNIKKNIELVELGYIKDKNYLAQVYSDADIFIIPSLAENYPCTIQESISCGTPCIGYNVGGNSELIIDSKTGIIVKKITSNGLKEKIEYILHEDSLINEFKSKIKKDIIVKSNEEMINEYINLYN